MNLKHLTDTCLLKDTLRLSREERHLSSKLLHYLKEVDHRKLFSDLQCPSMFHYCTRILGYSEGSAQRRIMAARLLGSLPEIEKKIEHGSLNLMTISSAVSFFRQESITHNEKKRDVLSQLENLTKKDCEKKLLELSGKVIPAREEKKRIAIDSMKVTMILSDETLEKLEVIQGLMNRRRSNEDLLNYMADLVIKVMRKKKFKLLD